jgi:hypothetical protein
MCVLLISAAQARDALYSLIKRVNENCNTVEIVSLDGNLF